MTKAKVPVASGKFAAYKSIGEQAYTEDGLRKIGRFVLTNGKDDGDGCKRMGFSDLGINWKKAWFVDTIENWKEIRVAFFAVGRNRRYKATVEHNKDWSYIKVSQLP